jgi:D-alanyl-D-alanine carboxypeptidase/D-alanyl-D-alanine-endopeptidase (penicillin-binding protein 4)
MKRFPTLLCFVISIFSLAPRAFAGVSDNIDAVLADKELSRAQVGIEIVRLGPTSADSRVIYQHNPNVPLIPASNLKVITTSAALEKLGASFKFQTRLLWHDGNLILLGDGDPTLGDAEMLKKVGWDVDTVFKTWATALARRHLAAAHDLLVDDSVFDQQFIHPHWPADQTQKRYVAQIAGLNLNANCIDIYVRPISFGRVVQFTTDPLTRYVTVRNTCIAGNDNAIWLSREPNTNDLILRGQANSSNDVPVSVTVNDPPLYTGTFLAETLHSAGINLTGSVKRDTTQRQAFEKSLSTKDHTWTILAVHETPLLSVISRANKDSMNLYAECVCKRLGFAETGQGTWPTGVAAVSKFLQSLRIPSSEYALDDGCGLSKHNAISSHLMTQVLSHDFFGPNAQQWMNCLAVAGEDGTLADRFRGSNLRGRVIAKSGFVNGVSCLSGYLHARDDNWYCFSILFNGIPEGSNSGAKALQERIVKAVDQHVAAQLQVSSN